MTIATITAPDFSAPHGWYLNIDATLGLLKDPALAIRFAIDHVEGYMVRHFLEDWQADRDAGETARVRDWLEEMKEAILYGQQVAEREQAAIEAVRNEPDYSDLRAFNRALAAERRQRAAR